MIAREKEFYLGAGLLAGFFVVLILIFLPLFEGKNGLNYLDDLYNSISKGSAYYIPKLKKDAEKIKGSLVTTNIKMKDDKQAKEIESLFIKAGAKTTITGAQIKVEGDLSQIMLSCLEDSDYGFNNDGAKIESKYGIEAKQVLYNWWKVLTAMDKSLSDEKQFHLTKIINVVQSKAVECSYNYFGIKAQKISTQAGIVIFSLVFYVIYTLWYGFSIMYLFEGLGLNIGH